VASEARHRETAAAFRNLLDAGRALHTTCYVVVETCALLQHRFGLPPVRDLVDALMPLVHVVWVSETLHRRGVERLLREDRRRLSLVDCVSFEHMRAEGLRDALTLDPDFEEAGFRRLPRP
jgi:predicted nucleic acid-binding protein